MAQTPNVVKATNRPGLYDELEDIQKRSVLITCTCTLYYCNDIIMHVHVDCLFVRKLLLSILRQNVLLSLDSILFHLLIFLIFYLKEINQRK